MATIEDAMEVACLVSGGKDSLYALYLASKEGHTIRHILTMIPESDESYMFHFPNASLTSLQAECLRIPLLTARTTGRKEEELEDLASLMRNLPVSGVVSGAVASFYQKERIDVLCQRFGFQSITPLWGKDPEEILEGMFSCGFEIIITGVSADGLGKDLLGKNLFDVKDEIGNLSKKYGVHILGEGGEYETFVCDMPLFKERILIEEALVLWQGNAGRYAIRKTSVASKVF